MKTHARVSTLLVAGLSLLGCGGDFVSAMPDTDGTSSSTSGDATTRGESTDTTGGETTSSESTDTTTTDASSSSAEGSDSGSDTGTQTGGETDTGTGTGTGTGGEDPVCGDGVVEGDEVCDDGGESKACNADCTAATCGDGVLNTTAGEVCDDGGESEACNADCTAAMCGDGVVNAAAGEDCDDGGESKACDSDCTAAMCGDGVTNASAGEDCDDGGASMTCDTDCTPAQCGDGLVNAAAGEACDGGPGCSDACEITCPGFSGETFDPAVTFAQGPLAPIPVSIAWDGTDYWAASGESAAGVRLVQHAADGMVVASFSPGIDFRSVFVQGDGTATVFARRFNNPVLRVMDAPGTFSIDATLAVADPSLDAQSGVVWNDDADELVALSMGVVQRWGADGTFIGVTALEGYGDGAGELDAPSNVRLAWGQGCYLTYADGVLSSWDLQGARVDTATLQDMATVESEQSVSFANGMVFLGTDTDWLGFDVF